MGVLYLWIGLGACLVAGFLLGRYNANNSTTNIRNRYDAEYSRAKYLYKSGYSGTYALPGGGYGVGYYLFSFDHGRTWYALDGNDNIRGLAEEVYPGLLKHLDNWDKVIAYAKDKGPINLSNAVGLKLLEGVGLTVKTNTTQKNEETVAVPIGASDVVPSPVK